MQRVAHVAAGFAVALTLTGPARAAVNDPAASGFSVTQTVHIAAPPEKVYAELVTPAH